MILAGKAKWVAVDEVQRVPALLNYVHRLIESHGIQFALSGSSSRKLKREGANLLAGRAWMNHLHPLIFRELQSEFSLDSVLRWGALPKVLSLADETDRYRFLKTYTQTYLREEIKQEQIVRKIEPFLRFLEVAAQGNGNILNYAKIARDALLDEKAVERYYEILKDTLIGYFLNPFHRSVRKRQTKKPKFFFFDMGVKRAFEGILQIPMVPGSSPYGQAFEHFFILECIRMNDYLEKDFRFAYLRTKDDLEIDLIIERPGQKTLLVEIKSGTVDDVEADKMMAISKDFGKNAEILFASGEKHPRKKTHAEILPWMSALEKIFGG